MRLRATIVAGVAAAAAGTVCTAAPALAATPAATPTQFCAIIGAAAPGPNTASPILGQGCFSTQAQENAFVQNKTATAAATETTLSPDSSLPLGFAASGENLSGNRYTFFGTSGACNGSTYYQFSNLNGPFDSAADNVVSGANCLDAYYWSGSNFNGRDWDCSAYYSGGWQQSCGVRMPSGDNGAAHSVRFRS